MLRTIPPRGLPIWVWGLLVAAAALAALPDGAGGDPLAPEILDPADPAWEDLLRLELSGALPVGLTSMRPATRGEVASWIAAARGDPRVDRASLQRLERSFARELRRIGSPGGDRETEPFLRLEGEDAPDDPYLDGARAELRIGPALGLQGRTGDGETEMGDSTRAGIYGRLLIGRSVAVQGELFVGEIEGGRKIGDPLVHGTDILYFAEEIGAAVATRDVRLRLARGRHRWGAGPGPALLLDAGSAPISFFEYDLRIPAGVRLRSWVGTLNAFEKRGIAAHRLEVSFGRNLRVAIAEGVRYPGGPEHPLYLLGLLPYTLVQRLDEQDTLADTLQTAQRNNILATAEIVWRPLPGGLVYLEILVDDIPAETANTPARLGGRIGFGAMPVVAAEPLEIRLEGTKIGRYTYSVDYRGECDCNWIQQERAIGEPYGPDQEALRLWVGRSLGRDHRLELRLLYANRGAGRLGEAWTGNTDQLTELTRRALEVSPPVARERRIGIVWRWDPRDNLFLESTASLARVREGEGGAREIRFLLALRSGWRL